MERKLYVTTVDEKNHTHHFKLPLTDTVPDGHEITNVRPAGVFRFTQLMSSEDLAKLNNL